MNVTTATTAELVAFYNAHSDRQIKKFQDRATAERRVTELLATLTTETAVNKNEEHDNQMLRQYGVVHCPHCGVHLSNGVGEHNDVVNDRVIRHKTNMYCCLACDGEFGPKIRGSKSVNNSDGVARSWNDPVVRAARSKRDGVVLTDGKGWKEQFRSVAAAYRAHGFPYSEHIAFRGLLKREGKAENYGYKWELI